MKKISMAIIILISGITSSAQPKYFEETITYKVTVKSKVKDLDDNTAKKILGMGDYLIVSIKEGYYKQTTGFSEVYYNPKEKKVYYKFKKIDTLYFQDYTSDTSQVIGVDKTDSLTEINHIKCKSLTIRRSNGSAHFFYTSSLQTNPEYDRDNTLERYDAYIKETGGGVWLLFQSEYNLASLSDSCIRIEQKNIDSHIFDLPDLPVKKFTTSAVSIPARLPGKENAWVNYLKNNLNSNLGAKYIKLPKGETTATQTVTVEFVVNEDGTIGDMEVLNKKEVHPKLAEEAMRVIRESPRWIPATIYGEKIIFRDRQDIVFQVSK